MTNNNAISITEGEKVIHLSKNQTKYLTLYSFGFKKRYIKEFMKLNDKQLNTIRFEIAKMFNEKDWKQIVYKAMDFGCLNRDEFLDDIVIETAVEYSQKFLNCNFDLLLDFMPRASLERFYESFLNACDSKFFYRNQNLKLTPQSKNLLILEYMDTQFLKKIKELNVSKSGYVLIKGDTLKEMRVSNMFAAIRKAFQCNILNKLPSFADYLTHAINMSLKQLQEKKLSEKKYKTEKLQLVFVELLQFYYEFEKLYLLHHFRQNQQENVAFKHSA